MNQPKSIKKNKKKNYNNKTKNKNNNNNKNKNKKKKNNKKKNKYTKGARWMPSHRKAKKDAAGCDKPRVGA